MCNQREPSTLPPLTSAEKFRETVDQGLREGRLFHGTPREWLAEASFSRQSARNARCVEREMRQAAADIANGKPVAPSIDASMSAEEARAIARDHLITARAFRRLVSNARRIQAFTAA